MPSQPLAYLITFSVYGVWLHGREDGSVDRKHNQVGTPLLPADSAREHSEGRRLRESPYLLDAQRRAVVLETMLEVARHRRWLLLACHVRTTHVHVVVGAPARPEKVMADFKAYASRRLKERLQEPADCKRWTQRGSTRYLWTTERVAEKVEYVVNGQGEPMAVYDSRQSPPPSEPDA